MKRTPKLYNGLMVLLKLSPWLDKRHLFTFVWMVVALIQSAKINLSEWTCYIVGRARYAQSHERRFKRWLYNDRIEALALYTPLIQCALQDWGGPQALCDARYFNAVEHLLPHPPVGDIPWTCRAFGLGSH
jgi:hypothetical protein